MSHPLVSVVIPTRDRPELVRRAIDAVFAQDHPGDVEVVVVFDQSDPEESLLREAPGRSVRIVRNTRTPGLAGARNSGILASRGELVAFCDDDDWWKPAKLRRQLEAIAAERARTGRTPHLVTTAMEVDFEGQRTPRLAGTERITLAHLTRSRMSMLHSSALLFDRQALLDRIGLVDEEVPGSQNEDWDLLLRSVKQGDIVHVDEPLIVVSWGAASFFTRTWDTKVSSLHWMMAQHPEIVADRKGVGRVYGQIAFGEASRPDRRAALSWAGKAVRQDPTQWRAYVAALVAARVVTPARVLNTLHKFGRGV
ncbi:glycosyltransferase family 2 protein [Nocardioides daphniae]|uniref:Glycosyl transferase n=1 Tax=Nocardioides daphniae TaxID=402297 RepID=A0A4P7UAF5_9ACTN|nr:glycosyltransferase family 2 protein [Nocardioides daphniae]QCC76561.1 glycosyltransferase family 2 protein [Nocardioides daphniae]GGD05323.1 glycosyl transferase [Nocardioides daphniae]